ncbi:HNH endonuclease [Haladaptatus sp. CMSO5]|uniref:HNH endonuclease n=1 Tax=Haladaptatus sp. CMSO5 TaxID=3120514 RepID=UPI002FCDEBCF
MSEQIPNISELQMGKQYHRVALHEKYGGARYRGIAPSAKQPYIFIFTGTSGEQHGYIDEFEGDTFIYTGEGQVGDMEWREGNKAIRNHKKDGREIHLFESTDEAWIVTYVGQFECSGWRVEDLKDTNGNWRKGFRFKLDPVSEQIDLDVSSLDELELDELFQRAVEASSKSENDEPRESTRASYSSSELVKAYARRIADGICQGCGESAPFTDKNGNPFLEVHHLFRRTDGGPDHPHNVIAICPNCHRRVHYGEDGEEFNQRLIEQAK